MVYFIFDSFRFSLLLLRFEAIYFSSSKQKIFIYFFQNLHFKIVLGCEDIILRRLSEETVIKIITWASESHGSNFVFRQCIQFLTDEFASFSQSEHFLQISQDVLTEVLQSDYVQASELQILKAVLRWGQHQVETKDLSESCPTDEYSSTSQTSNCYEPNASSSSQIMYSRSVSYGDGHAHRVGNITG